MREDLNIAALCTNREIPYIFRVTYSEVSLTKIWNKQIWKQTITRFNVETLLVHRVQLNCQSKFIKVNTEYFFWYESRRICVVGLV
jgi:hypothetical protein